MAIDTTFISKYRYFKNSWGVVDEKFIRDTLLPGLQKQGKYSAIARGIQLDDEDPPEYLPLDEASKLILDWLSETNYLDQETINQLKTLLRPGTYTKLAKILTTKFNNIGEQKRVAVATNEDRLEAYRQHLTQSGEPATSYRFSSAEAISRYHSTREEIITLLRRGYTADQLKQLSFLNPTTDRLLFTTLADNLSRLYSSSYQFGQDEELRSQAVAKELFQIIREEHSELTDILPALRDPAWSHALTRTLDQVATTTNSKVLRQLEFDKHLAYKAQADLLPTRSELHDEIELVFSRGGLKQPDKLADAILTEIIASYGSQISVSEVVRLASQRIGEDPKNLTQVVELLQKQGLDVAVEYHQREIHILYQGVRLSRAEKKLLAQGISFLHSTDRVGDVKLAILEELKIESSPNLRETLKQEYQSEQKADPTSPRLKTLRTLQEHYYHSAHLTDEQVQLLKKSRFGRLDIGTKINLLSDKVYDFYDTATGGKIIRNFYDWYDKAAEGEAVFKLFGRELKIKTTIDIPLGKGKKLKIPLLGLSSWAFDQWDLLKKRATLQAYRFFSSNKVPKFISRPARWVLRQYRLGDYTVDGAIFQFAHRQVGRLTTWALAKTGLSSVFKYASGKAVGIAGRYSANFAARTAVRFFIKVGGKALGKLAAKALTSLVAAATTIGAVLSVIGIISMAVDLIKFGYQFIKEFLTNIDFRKQVLKAWGIVTGILLSISVILGTVFAFIAALFNPLTWVAILSVFISLGLVAFTSISYQLSNNTIPGLDVKYDPPASAANLGAASGCKDQQIPAPAGAGIPTRASEIVADLHGGFWGYCNRPTNPEKTGPGSAYSTQFPVKDEPKNKTVYLLSNRPNLFDYDLFKTNQDPTREEIQTSGNALYWCTYLVQHSYRESGKSGFSTSLWSPTLEDEFRASHTFIEGSAANSSNIKPGDIVFFKTDGGPDRTNHVGVVNDVLSNGFSYYQSNAPTINGNGTFDGSGASAEPGIMVVGFGRLK